MPRKPSKTKTRKPKTRTKTTRKSSKSRTRKPKTKPKTTRKTRTRKTLVYPKPAAINNRLKIVPAGEAPSKQRRREGRPSPSISATIVPVGTKKRGNDGNMYVVKSYGARNIQRWVRY